MKFSTSTVLSFLATTAVVSAELGLPPVNNRPTCVEDMVQCECKVEDWVGSPSNFGLAFPASQTVPAGFNVFTNAFEGIDLTVVGAAFTPSGSWGPLCSTLLDDPGPNCVTDRQVAGDLDIKHTDIGIGIHIDPEALSGDCRVESANVFMYLYGQGFHALTTVQVEGEDVGGDGSGAGLLSETIVDGDFSEQSVGLEAITTTHILDLSTVVTQLLTDEMGIVSIDTALQPDPINNPSNQLDQWAIDYSLLTVNIICPNICDPPSSTSGGDPHFKTFGGDWFDFHGGCDLMLADFPSFSSGAGLMVQARTTTRYDYSFIEAAAIRIGEDILEVFSYGQYLVNGVSNAALPATISGYPVTHTKPRENVDLFTIDFGDKRSIEVKVFKDLVYVNMNVHNGVDDSMLEDGVGMLGPNSKHARLARDGVTVVEDVNEFGVEWQVRDTEPKLFMTDRAPQWPATCQMPNSVERAARRLGENRVSSDAATEACAHIKEEHAHDMCVFDVIATGDLDVAQGGAY